MKRHNISAFLIIFAFGLHSAHAKSLLEPFRSDKELREFLEPIVQAATPVSLSGNVGVPGVQDLQEVAVTASKIESITNNQTIGVDEGDIVKLHGDYLVVLRRGRLFTVSLREHAIRSVAAVNAYAPNIKADADWYDEMLVSENTVVVIGYSYGRGGTEIGLFDIDNRGNLKFRSTYHLRSGDYYSSRNYASRLVGNQLVFYSALDLTTDGKDALSALPSMRKWRAGENQGEFKRIATANRVYKPTRPLDRSDTHIHTITQCDLSQREMTCTATSVFGPSSRVFYASTSAFYLWISNWPDAEHPEGVPSMVYRMPLDGSPPKALQVAGSPVDQFSFLEGDGFLNAVVVSEGAGDGMWRAEMAQGDVALLRFPLSNFNVQNIVPRSRYRELPNAGNDTFQNRFVGKYLLYGTGDGWRKREGNKSKLVVTPITGGKAAELDMPHSVDRIEALGDEAVVVGTDEDETLHFSGVSLSADPEIVKHYEIENASQGELRSHGFFYKAQGPNAGILGLPISKPGRPGYEELFERSSAVVFIRNGKQALHPMGELAANDDSASPDYCVASCTDWYGNSRPIFVGSRIFALLGYELVEGVLAHGKIREVLRANLTPINAAEADEEGVDEED